MGTNYYLRIDVCPVCGRPAHSLHVGKSSAGWAFALCTHPDEGIYDLPDWEGAWAKENVEIWDEYDRAISPEAMKDIITNRSHPRGLTRSAIDGWHCIAHGAGTWDLMKGEFS